MKKDMFVKFLDRLFGDEDHYLDGVVKHGNATMATDARVALWAINTPTDAPLLTSEKSAKTPGVIHKTMQGEVLATATINARYLWLLGKTLGNKDAGGYDDVTIQIRQWADENHNMIVAATKDCGMLILPVRAPEPSPESTPFLFWDCGGAE